jgi:hypothetical protein
MSRGDLELRQGQLGRRIAVAVPLILAASAGPALQAKQTTPIRETASALVPFRNAPFPYDGADPETGAPFFDVSQDGRRGHTSPRGGIYWQDTTYSDDRVLVALPEGFDLARPAVLVVYFHGNDATLQSDVVGRQRVLEQLGNSGLNGALVAPQLAVDALDSSAGRFWVPGTFARFLREAATHLAELYSDASVAPTAFDKLPVVLVAYSGGYDPAAYALTVGGAGERLVGVILLDAAFGQTDKFVSWVARNRPHAFFFSAYTAASAAGNAAIESGLATRDIDFTRAAPVALVPGSVTFLSADGAEHEDFVTSAWVNRPLTWLLARIPRFSRRSEAEDSQEDAEPRDPH